MPETAKPYTAINGFLDRSPQDLSAPGKEMEFYPRLTTLVRMATSLPMKDIIIDETEIERYQNAGTVLVAPSHRSYMDITATSVLSYRSGESQPYYMSKRENMENKAFAWLYGHMRTFPIDRDMTDPRWATAFIRWGRFAMGHDIEKGEQNKKLVMFPEATRKKGDVIEDLEPGTLVLAKKIKVPILPVGVAATHIGMRGGRPKVLVAVGEPFEAGLRDIDLLAEKMQEQYDRARYSLEELIAA